MKNCECGCGQELVSEYRHDGKPRRFIKNHDKKKHLLKPTDKKFTKGKDHWNFRNGRTFHKGYWYLKIHSHPNSDKRGYIPEHVFVYTEYYKCCMLPWGIIHHINGKRGDNRIDNLQGMFQSKHFSIHLKGNEYYKLRKLYKINQIK